MPECACVVCCACVVLCVVHACARFHVCVVHICMLQHTTHTYVGNIVSDVDGAGIPRARTPCVAPYPGTHLSWGGDCDSICVGLRAWHCVPPKSVHLTRIA